MVIIKSLVLQMFWFAIVIYGAELHVATALVLGLSFLLIDYKLSSPSMNFLRYSSIAVFFVSFGLMNDLLLIEFNLIDAGSYSFNYLLLWVVFIGYFEEVLKRLIKFPLWCTSLIGGFGGSLAYISASKLGALDILPSKDLELTLFVFISWSIFLPLALWIYFMKSFKNYLLDKLVITSFDLTGFKRHQREFDEYPDLSEVGLLPELANMKALVTGGTSGIGKSVLTTLSSFGVSVEFVGRNESSGEEIQNNFAKSKFHKLDMSSWGDIKNFSKETAHYDYIVLNAGGMPEQKVLNDKGVEQQCASQLLGHYILLNILRENKQISHSTKIVWVSSGGMYLKKLDLDNLINPSEYDKVDTYANVKRAQVTLVEELAKSEKWKDYQNFSMHPGWVGTNGLKQALPKFYNLLEKRLRGVSEGSDTIVWLLITKNKLANGGFYFDRSKVKPYFLSGYNPQRGERDKLIQTIDRYTGKALN